MKRLFLVIRPLQTAVTLSFLALVLTLVVSAQPGGVKGKVRTNSGQGIPSALITISKDGKEIKSAQTDSSGNFEVKGIDPGFYSLRVEAKGYASGSMSNVEIKKNKTRDLGDRLFLNIDQGSQVILKGSVFFKEGTSVTGAKVTLERVNSDGSIKELGTTYSSVSGEFTFRQPEGVAKYRVTARYNGVSGTKEISVENAALYRLAITLDLSSKDK